MLPTTVVLVASFVTAIVTAPVAAFPLLSMVVVRKYPTPAVAIFVIVVVGVVPAVVNTIVPYELQFTPSTLCCSVIVPGLLTPAAQFVVVILNIRLALPSPDILFVIANAAPFGRYVLLAGY